MSKSQLKRLGGESGAGLLQEGERHQMIEFPSETSIGDSNFNKLTFKVKVLNVPFVKKKLARVKKLACTKHSIQGESLTPPSGGYKFGALKLLMEKVQEVTLVKNFHEDLMERKVGTNILESTTLKLANLGVKCNK